MRPSRHASIRTKLTRITMATCLLAVALSGLSLVAHEVFTHRRTLSAELSTQARILGQLSRAALSFADATEATQILHELQGQPNVEEAMLYKDGRIFAHYARHRKSPPPSPVEPIADAESLGRNSLTVTRRIEFNGAHLGTVVIRSNLKQLRDSIAHRCLILLGVFGASTLAAWLISARLQNSMVRPIQLLTETATAIANGNDYSRRAPKVSHDEFGELADAFNSMISRIGQQDTALRDSESRYRILFKNSPLPAWLFDGKTLRFLAVNDAALRNYGYTEEEFLSLTAPCLCGKGKAELPSAECLSRPMERMQSTPGRHRRKDGTIIDVEVSADAIEHHDRLVWLAIAQDVTARKKAEADLAVANEQLIRSSRQAGMAEVATGVLHNVGNVLNSVNVSANLIRNKLVQSRLTSLAKTTELLQSRADDLAFFLSQDPQGRLIPGFLGQLTTHLLEERDHLIAETRLLVENIEHIREIVAVQQGVAKVSGVVEPLDPIPLFEDALRMGANSFGRRGFEVVHEFQPTSRIVADRHKVLQILINLLTNAQHALDQSPREPKRLTLRIGPSGRHHVFLAVQDNGVGISRDAHERIFQLGFTTRKDGHGFGLHSGAIAAREMGGNLSVHSDGPGCGATFRLELPTEPSDESTRPAAIPDLPVHQATPTPTTETA
ncbi:MAG: PAS domain S-box protein [Verrucomicrobiales bacterium]|nr:PAS domain S-box protein [Verrucomicrobiales bacterium]